MTDPPVTELHGQVDPGFEPVRDAFAGNFADHGDVGAAVCVYRGGRPVVDLWAGVADQSTGRPWDEDTVVMTFSTTKGMTATCVHLLVERGEIDLDAPVAEYWPEFAAAGKAEIPLRWLLSHRAGLAAVDGDLTMEDVLGWEGVVEAIAEQAPNWEPGTTHGYHARSYGWTLGEVVRRVTGRSLGRFFREQIGEPLGLDFWIGLPDVVEPRCANLIPLETEGVSLVDLLPGDSLLRRVMVGPSDLFAGGYDESWNTRPLRAAEMPSSNGIGDARSIARFYAALVGAVDGVRVLRPATVARATEVQSSGTDQVLGVEMTFGLGYLLQPTVAPGAGRAAFGHAGAGGSLGFADPEAGISFGYAMNRLKLSLTGDERTLGLVAALYESLRRG